MLKGLTYEVIKGRRGKLNICRCGPVIKPILICLHGGPGLDHSSLLPGVLELANLFHLILIDLHGNGQSTAKDNGFSLDSYVEDVCDVLKTLKPTQPIGILGHSFGGSVAIKTLAEANHGFDFSILVNTPLDKDWMDYVAKTSKTMVGPTAEEIEKRFETSARSDEDFKEYCIAYAPLYFSELRTNEAREIMEFWIYRSPPYLFAAQNILPNMDFKTDCEKIKIPCLVVGGEVDKIIPVTDIQRTAQLISRSDFFIIKGAGHFPFLTRPEDFRRAVEGWWRKARKV